MTTDPNCIFCKIVAGSIPSFKLFEDAETLAFMDINPANDGHCLVIPKAHYPTVFAIAPEAFAAADISAAAADHVLMNPPFNAAHNPSPDRGRRVAHVGTPDTLRRWIKTAAWLLRPAGVLTLIWRADGLDAALAGLSDDFGAIGILPIHAKPDAPAIRVLVRAVKESRGPLVLLRGLVLTDANGQPTREAEAVLREGAAVLLSAG